MVIEKCLRAELHTLEAAVEYLDPFLAEIRGQKEMLAVFLDPSEAHENGAVPRLVDFGDGGRLSFAARAGADRCRGRSPACDRAVLGRKDEQCGIGGPGCGIIGRDWKIDAAVEHHACWRGGSRGAFCVGYRDNQRNYG